MPVHDHNESIKVLSKINVGLFRITNTIKKESISKAKLVSSGKRKQYLIKNCFKNGIIKLNLRVRAVFRKTVRVCHVFCNFKTGFTRRITVIFGTLKDGSLLINTSASNICFSYRNMFQNGVDALSKIDDAFLSKSSKFYLVWII